MAITIPIATQLTNDPSIRSSVKVPKPEVITTETPIEKKDTLHTFEIRNANRIVGTTRGGTPLTAYEAYYMEMVGQGSRINYNNLFESTTGKSYAASAMNYARSGEGVAIRDPAFYDRIDARESQRLNLQAEKALHENRAAAYAATANANLANPFKMVGYGITGGTQSIEKNVVLPEVKTYIQRREKEDDIQFISKTAWSSTTGDIAKTYTGYLALGGLVGIGSKGLAAAKITVPARITMPLTAGLIGVGVGLEAVKIKTLKNQGKTNIDVVSEFAADLTRLAVGSKAFVSGYQSIVGKPVIQTAGVSKSKFDTKIKTEKGMIKALDYGSGGEKGKGVVQGKSFEYRTTSWSESEAYAIDSKAFGSVESYTVGKRTPITQFERFTGRKAITFKEVDTSSFSGYTSQFKSGNDMINTFSGKTASGSKVSDIIGFERDLISLPETQKVLWIDYGIKTGGAAANIKSGAGVVYNQNRFVIGDYLRNIEFMPEVVKPITKIPPSQSGKVLDFRGFDFSAKSTGGASNLPLKTGVYESFSMAKGGISAKELTTELMVQTSSATSDSAYKGLSNSITKAVDQQKIVNALALKPIALNTQTTKTDQKLAASQIVKPILSTLTSSETRTVILPIINTGTKTAQKLDTKMVIPTVEATIPQTPLPPPITPTGFKTPPLPPITIAPAFDFDLTEGMPFKRKKGKKRKGNYTPSFIATYLNIKGKKSLKNELTGLGVRKINKRIGINKLGRGKIRILKMTNPQARKFVFLKL